MKKDGLPNAKVFRNTKAYIDIFLGNNLNPFEHMVKLFSDIERRTEPIRREMRKRF